MFRYILVMMALVLMAGCGRKSQETVPAAPRAEESVEAAYNTLLGQARQHYHEGDTDAAIDLLTAGLAEPHFTEYQSALFRALLELLLQEDRVLDAQTHYLAMLQASPANAAQAFSMIPEQLKRKDDPALYLAWTEKMVNTDLPSTIVESAYGYYVDANLLAGRYDRLDTLARTACTRFGGAAGARILARPLYALIDQKRYAAVSGVLAELRMTGDGAADNLVTSSELILAAARGEWDAVVSGFTAMASRLPDSSAKLVLDKVSLRAAMAGQVAVVDQLCEHVVRTMPTDAAAYRQAVASYIDVAVKAGQLDDAVARLQHLKMWDVSASEIGARINSVLYGVMNEASDVSKKTVLDLLEWIVDETENGVKAQYQGLLMDGSVMCNDYKRAMGILNDGFRADDVEWHAMAANKLGAHLALQEGRIDDAVAQFRGFMAHVATWTEAALDPSTGLTHTREMSMGFNAKRIAAILRDAGRTNEATQAYAEARGYYEAALAVIAEDSREYTYVQKELAEIAGAESAQTP